MRENVQLLNEQKPGDVRPASQTPNNESSSCPISPFLVQNNPSLEIILSPSSNIIIEDASTPTNLNSQSIDNVATGIEIAMKYGDDLLVEEVVKSVPKGNSKHFFIISPSCCSIVLLFASLILFLQCPVFFLYVSLCCQHNTYYMQLLNWTDPLVPEKQSSDVTLNMSGPSTIEKRNRKKRKAKSNISSGKDFKDDC